MTRWAAFAGITVAVLALLLVLARASQSVLTGPGGLDTSGESRTDDSPGAPESAGRPGGTPDAVVDSHDATVAHTDAVADPTDTGTADDTDASGTDPTTITPTTEEARQPDGESPISSGRPGSSRPAGYSSQFLLINVAVSQGLLAAIIAGGAWYAQVPAGALGLPTESLGWQAAAGIGFGLALAAANAAGAALAGALGFDPSEQLRELLAPESAGGWALLLLVVLPVIAGFEELLFRGALVGAFAAGFGISPWVLAGLSSVAFAVGHGAQGTAGVLVTGLLGFVLAAGFVITGSLVVVVVAHYVVNAVEFVVFEGMDVDVA